MSQEELRRIVQDFTGGVLGGQSVYYQCSNVCVPLHAYLSVVEGYETKLIQGKVGNISGHWWLDIGDNQIIDPTAAQFPAFQSILKSKNDVFVGAKPASYVPTKHMKDEEKIFKPFMSLILEKGWA